MTTRPCGLRRAGNNNLTGAEVTDLGRRSSLVSTARVSTNSDMRTLNKREDVR